MHTIGETHTHRQTQTKKSLDRIEFKYVLQRERENKQIEEERKRRKKRTQREKPLTHTHTHRDKISTEFTAAVERVVAHTQMTDAQTVFTFPTAETNRHLCTCSSLPCHFTYSFDGISSNFFLILPFILFLLAFADHFERI